MSVDRFYCREPACPRRTFAEHCSKLLAYHAQPTRRLARSQTQAGLALGALSAARLLLHLAMSSSATTLLRTIQWLPLPNTPRPCIVGVVDGRDVRIRRSRFNRAPLRMKQPLRAPAAAPTRSRRSGRRPCSSRIPGEQDRSARVAFIDVPASREAHIMCRGASATP